MVPTNSVVCSTGLASSSTMSTGMGGMLPRPRPSPPPPDADCAPPPQAAATPSNRSVTNSGGFSDVVINKVVRPNRMQGGHLARLFTVRRGPAAKVSASQSHNDGVCWAAPSTLGSSCKGSRLSASGLNVRHSVTRQKPRAQSLKPAEERQQRRRVNQSSLGTDRRFVESHQFAFRQHVPGHGVHHFVAARAWTERQRRVEAKYLEVIMMRPVVFWRMRTEVADGAVRGAALCGVAQLRQVRILRECGRHLVHVA